jgi:hypothetical protein
MVEVAATQATVATGTTTTVAEVIITGCKVMPIIAELAVQGTAAAVVATRMLSTALATARAMVIDPFHTRLPYMGMRSSTKQWGMFRRFHGL